MKVARWLVAAVLSGASALAQTDAAAGLAGLWEAHLRFGVSR